jgi:RecA/RadA recombinase
MARPKKEKTADGPVKVDGKLVYDLLHKKLASESAKLTRLTEKEDAKTGSEKKKQVIGLSSASIEDKEPPPYAISTGLPSFDLHLVRAANGEYGFPGARIIEILGPESSLKTTMGHRMVGNILAKGGLAFWIQTEFEFDPEYAKGIYADCGVDVSGPLPVEVIDANTTGEVFIAMQTIVANIKAIAIEGKEHNKGKKAYEYMPRVLIFIDSLGALMATENRGRLEGDFDSADKTGGHAKDLHDIFKFFMRDCYTLGVTLAYTNHYRDNLKSTGPFSKQHNPAHNSATKYYASVRVDFRFFNDPTVVAKQKSIKGSDPVDFGKLYKMTNLKKRGRIIGDESVGVAYYLNFGPDYLQSLQDASVMCGLFKLVKKEYHLQPEVLTEESDQLMMRPFVDDNGEPIPMSDSQYRDLLIDVAGLAMGIEALCYQLGPIYEYGDPRKMKTSEIDEIGK